MWPGLVFPEQLRSSPPVPGALWGHCPILVLLLSPCQKHPLHAHRGRSSDCVEVTSQVIRKCLLLELPSGFRNPTFKGNFLRDFRPKKLATRVPLGSLLGFMQKWPMSLSHWMGGNWTSLNTKHMQTKQLHRNWKLGQRSPAGGPWTSGGL